MNAELRISADAASAIANCTHVVCKQPLHDIAWVERSSLQPNNYNPNKMAPPEFELLKVSLLADGWTQPIVIFQAENGECWIVDGFHRWSVSADPEVAAMTDGLVPVVLIRGDENHRMMSTIRHNRARGQHGVVPMGEIVRKLLEGGMTGEQVQELLKMEDEEVERLAERAGMPVQITRTKKEFSKGWIPG